MQDKQETKDLNGMVMDIICKYEPQLQVDQKGAVRKRVHSRVWSLAKVNFAGADDRASFIETSMQKWTNFTEGVE